jgi:recombination protein U
MATWGSRGLRGSTLEDLINLSIEQYRKAGLGLVQKIPTPIKPLEIDKKTRHITLAYFDQKSTVDYRGVVQGIPICFDAKECMSDTFPMANIHGHQMVFMEDFEKQDGIAFILLYMEHRDELYYIPFRKVSFFWKRAEDGGRKSFTYDEIDKSYRIMPRKGLPVPFLDALKKDIDSRQDL